MQTLKSVAGTCWDIFIKGTPESMACYDKCLSLHILRAEIKRNRTIKPAVKIPAWKGDYNLQQVVGTSPSPVLANTPT